MKTRIFGKKDLILIGVLLLLATVLFCLFSLFAREGTYAVIRKDDRVVTIFRQMPCIRSAGIRSRSGTGVFL